MLNIIQGLQAGLDVKRALNALLSEGSHGSGLIAGGVGAGAGVTPIEYGIGAYRTTVFNFNQVKMTLLDAQNGNGMQIYTFPKGKILRLGASAENVVITTTSALASTLNAGVTGNYGLGSTTQANGTLATTEQDFVQTQNFTASATINVPPAAVRGFGIPNVTLLDGSSTPIALFFNIGIATATDIDGDATVLVDGQFTVNWLRV